MEGSFWVEFGGWILGLCAAAVSTTISVIVTHKTKQQLAKKDENELAQKEKNQELEKMLQEKKDEKFKAWVLSEMEPVIEELRDMKVLLEQKEQAIIEYHNDDEDYVRAELREIQEKIKKIVHSYKFRLIRLCNIHINAGWISTEDFDQLSTLYQLYTDLGGNGQMVDYYNRVRVLPSHPDEIH